MNSPSFGRVYRAYTLAMGAASVNSALSVPAGIKVARIVSSVNCWVKWGPSPEVATVGGTGMTFLPAGYVEIVAVDQGDLFAVIPDTGSVGNLNVSEITR